MQKPITRAEWKKLWSFVRCIATLATNHDPDHAKELTHIRTVVEKQFHATNSLLQTCEHRLDRIGAPQYRVISKGKPAKLFTKPISLKRKTK
jgi:hypothetical protein